jgi:hypothetical protein
MTKLRADAPNDPKLRDSGVRRGSCVVGGKAAAEAATVTHGAVLCSAWLGVGMLSLIVLVEAVARNSLSTTTRAWLKITTDLMQLAARDTAIITLGKV